MSNERIHLWDNFFFYIRIDSFVCFADDAEGDRYRFGDVLQIWNFRVDVGSLVIDSAISFKGAFPGIVHSFGLGAFLCCDRIIIDDFLFVYTQRGCDNHSFPLSGRGGCDNDSFFKDKVSFPLLIAVFMAISGVFLLSRGAPSGEMNLKGFLLVLMTVITYAIYIVGVNKSCVRGMEGLTLTFYVLSVGAVVFGVHLWVKGEMLDRIPDWSTGIYLVLLALIPTLVSDFTLILSVQHIGSTTTAILGCMEPLTAVVMGVFF